MTHSKATVRRRTCRYIRNGGRQCTAEAMGDETAEIELCSEHLAAAMRMLRLPSLVAA